MGPAAFHPTARLRSTSRLTARRAVRLSLPARYGVAVAMAVAAILFRLALDPLWGVKLPYITLFPAIMVSAWVGGLWPGIITTFLTGVAAEYLWIEPRYSWRVANLSELLAIATFAIVGLLISALNEAWRRGTVALSESEEGLNVTLTSIGDAVIAADNQGRITRMNAVAERLTGWTATDAIGQHVSDVFVIVNEFSRERASSPVERVLREGVVAGLADHTLLLSKDGRETPIDDSAAPIRTDSGEMIGAVMVFRDIAGRRAAEHAQAALLERERLVRGEIEQARRDSETAAQQLRAALAAGQMGTWEYTIATGDVKWSPGLEAIHGYAPGTFPGTFEAFRQEIHEDDRERVVRAIAAASEQRCDHHIEYRIVRRDGHVRWVEERGQLFVDDAGQPDRMMGVCADITERKEVERISSEQAELLRTIDDAIYEVDPDIRITSWNAGAERLYGFSASEAIGQYAPDLLRAKISSTERATYVKRLKQEQVVRFETELHRKDATPVIVNLTAIEKRNEDGTLRSIVAIHRDVTALRRADERFRLAVEAAPAAMIMIDQRGTIVLANALTERVLGYSRNDLLGQPVDRLIPQRFRQSHPRFRTGFFAAPQQRPMGAGRDLYALKNDGSEVPVEIGLSPIETAEGLFVLAAVTDITDRKRAESALLASEAESRRQLAEITSLYHAAPSGLCVFDRQFRYVRVNPALAVMNGLAPEDHIGRTPFDVLPDIAGPAKEVFDRVLETGAPLRAELRGTTPAMSAKERVWDEQWYPLHNSDGAVVGVGVIVDDITDRKQLEDDRGRLLVREQAARVEADAANRAKDVFFARVSHELRNPLNALRGWTRMLRDGQVAANRVAQAVDSVDRSAEALQTLVQDLIELSRVTTKALQLDHRPLDIGALTRDAVMLLEPGASAKGIRIETTIEAEGVMVDGDETRLRQVFWNLLSNAIKFTPRGGRVALHLRVNDGAVDISVSDTGQGIDSEFLAHIFEPFSQAEHGGPGLGLGLAIVQQLLTAHGGSITATSPGAGAGATFTVRLPMARVQEST